MVQKRDAQIDVARGIAILLVLLGHSSYTLDDPINKIILAFHMPLFFFLSGLVAKPANMINTTGGGYILKKIKAILIPQLFLGVLSYTYYALFTVFVKGGNLKQVDILYQFWRYWFLQVLFVTVILFFILSKFFDMKKQITRLVLISVSLVFGIFFSYVRIFPDESPLYLNVVPIAFFFYMIGYTIKNNYEKLWMRLFKNTVVEICLMLIMVGILFACALSNTSVTMYNNQYGNFILFIIGAFSGIAAILIISDKLKNSVFLNWCGVNSIIIYVWNFVLTQFFKNIVEIVMVKVYPNCPHIIMTIFVFILCLLCVIPIVWLGNKYIPELYGKEKTEKKCSMVM